jgi:hypothetical protein
MLQHSRRGALSAFLLLLGAALPPFAACRAGSPADASDDGGDNPFPTFDATGVVDSSLTVRAALVLTRCSAQGDGFGCHSSNAGNMSLATSDNRQDPSVLIDAQSFERPDMVRIKPGDPEHSYLWLKLVGDGGIDGAQMPCVNVVTGDSGDWRTFKCLQSDPLPPNQMQDMHDWIEAGAEFPM